MKTNLLVVVMSLVAFTAACTTEHSEAVTIFESTPLPTPTQSQTPMPQADNEFRQALEDIWIDDDRTKIGNILISRKCTSIGDNDYLGECELSIRRGRKVFRTFSTEHARKYWIQYGFKDLLGKGSNQLIVHTYSGGAHCCYDYFIYDLKPNFRIIYDSSQYDSYIGNELVPIDIDGDGVLEFYQDVMAFDYLGSAGHANSSFPPAIFAYERRAEQYRLATKRFPDFVMKLLEPLVVRTGQEGVTVSFDEYIVRTQFLYMVYAGKRDQAWKYFDANYRSDDPDSYMEHFREQFRTEFKDIFSKDPTYRSIYGN